MEDDKVETTSKDGLPKYSLRVSMRAKRMHLSVNHWGKVEVVIPRNASISHVVPFVHRHRKWLERTLAKIQAKCDDHSTNNQHLPEKIRLLSLGEDWEVNYQESARSNVRAFTGEADRRGLLIKLVDELSARVILRSWIHKHARLRLLPWLRQLSEGCCLPYSRGSIRAQKTRWGSCSAHGHINLNQHLIFLPPNLVRYVMIHELCHTVHLNHSLRYWALVNHFVPEFKTCEAELREAARYIPIWACPE